MATLAELIAELQAEGAFDSAGEFTLDRDRARDKMRRFQLADPRTYVLELVQAAVLSSATYARFDIDADDLFLTFDGRPFERADFDVLHSSVFSRDESRQVAARRQLALGLESAMALDPKWVKVHSGDAVMEMRPNRDDLVQQADSARQDTKIHVRDRFGNRTVVRFFRKLQGSLAEVVHLRRHCGHARLPIYLGKQRISGQPPLPELLGRVELSTEERWLVVGFDPYQRQGSRLLLACHGVQIAEHRDELPGLVAWVEDSSLSKDVSQRDVIRDAAYEVMLAAVNEAMFLAIEQLAQATQGESPTLLAFFRQVLCHDVTVPAMQGLVAKQAAQPGQELPESPAKAVASIPMWPSVRSAGEESSLYDLVKYSAAKRFGISAHRVAGLAEVRGGVPILWVPSAEERRYLKAVFGKKSFRAERRLEGEAKRQANQRRWRSRKMQARLPGSLASMVMVPLASEEAVGEVGLQLDPFNHQEVFSHPPLWLIKDGYLLERRTMASLIPGLVVVIEADFKPNRSFDSVATNAVFTRVMLDLARTLRLLFDQLALEWERDPEKRQRHGGAYERCLLPYLAMDWQGKQSGEFLQSVGLTQKRYLKLAARLLKEQPLPTLQGLDVVAAPDESAILRLPLFRTLQGREISLAELADSCRSDGVLRFVPEDRRFIGGLEIDAPVLLTSELELLVLQRAFGAQVVDFSTGLGEAMARAEYMRRPTVEVALTGICRHQSERDGVKIWLSFLPPTGTDDPGTATIHLLKMSRHLAEVQRKMSFSSFEAWVEAAQVPATTDWQDAEPGSTLDRLLLQVIDEGRLALRQVAEQYAAQTTEPFVGAKELLLDTAGRLSAAKEQHSDRSTGMAPDESSLLDLLLHLPLLETWSDERLTIAELHPHVARKPWRFLRQPGLGGFAAADLAELAGLEEWTQEPILKLTLTGQKSLAHMLADGALVDAQGFLRARLEARDIVGSRQIERFELSERQVMVKASLSAGEGPVELSAEASGKFSMDVSGEVGLVATGGFPGLRMDLYREGRLYYQWQTECPLSLIAVLNDDRLPLDDTGLLDLSSAALEWHRRRCWQSIPGLIARLLENPAPWQDSSRQVARQHVVDFLISEQNREVDRDAATESVWQAAAKFAAFDSTTGTASFVELQQSYSRFDYQAYLLSPAEDENRPQGAAADRRQLVLVLNEDEVGRLTLLFGRMKDWQRRWPEEKRLAQQISSRPEMPRSPKDALVHRNLARLKGLEVNLWLPAKAAEPLVCSFGCAGREFWRETLSPVFPCAGTISGKALTEREGVSVRQRQALRQEAFELYYQLAQELADPANGRVLSSEVEKRARSLLVDARLALQRTHDNGLWKLSPSMLEFALHDDREPLRGTPSASTEGRVAKVVTAADSRSGVAEPPAADSQSGAAVDPQAAHERELLELLRQSLTGSGKAPWLKSIDLDRIALNDLDVDWVAQGFEHGTMINRRHPLVVRLLAASPVDPVLMAFLISSVFTAINHFWRQIEDDHERDFQRQMITRLVAEL